MKTSMLMLMLGATLVGGLAICDWCETPTALAASTAPAPAGSGTKWALNAEALDTSQQVVLHIEGMTCGGCTLATRKVLTRLDGVGLARPGACRGSLGPSRPATRRPDPVHATGRLFVAAAGQPNPARGLRMHRTWTGSGTF